MILVDLVTEWTFCESLNPRLRVKTSAEDVTDKQQRIFETLGIPLYIKMDRGPHFRGSFKELLKQSKIPFTPSSLYNQSSNRLVEQ